MVVAVITVDPYPFLAFSELNYHHEDTEIGVFWLHCAVLMDMAFRKNVKRKVKFRKKLKLWRLGESKLKEEFADGVNNKCDGNEDWYDLKSKLLGVVSEVCGYTKGKLRYFETWWWNKDMDVTVH